MNERWTAWRRVAVPLVAGLLISGCYVSTDYGRYPEGKSVKAPALVREWSPQGVELVLTENGAFSATGLTLEHFECSAEGFHAKSGDGTWATTKGRESTTVLVKFEDGCHASLWTGESEGNPVLWATQADDDEVLILK